jgi:hypothetical protein
MKPQDRTPESGERFLSRWSRLKRANRGEPGMPSAADAAPAALELDNAPAADAMPDAVRAAPAPFARADAPSVAARQDDDVPALPPVDSLTIDSDYAPFFQPKVPEALRRAAVKKLFADPHFNKMDGLDTYIDDYTKPDPIPESMLRSLNHAQGFFEPVADPAAAHEAASATMPAANEAASAAVPATESERVANTIAIPPVEASTGVEDVRTPDRRPDPIGEPGSPEPDPPTGAPTDAPSPERPGVTR